MIVPVHHVLLSAVDALGQDGECSAVDRGWFVAHQEGFVAEDVENASAVRDPIWPINERLASIREDAVVVFFMLGWNLN